MILSVKIVYVSTLWLVLIQCSPEETVTENDEGRIYEGMVARSGQIPWQVDLNIRITEDEGASCGGSLISERWVVTAAHCLFRPEDGLNASAGDVTVTAGSLRPEEQKDGQQLIGEEIILHPEFEPILANNDIALIRLEKSVKMDGQTGTIKLGSEYVENGTTVFTSGWGDRREGEFGSPILIYVDLTTISNDECAKEYDAQSIIDGTICTRGQGGKNTCRGDSGGPLFTKSKGVDVLVGITSFGKNIPSAFTRISHYRDWIRENTEI